MAYNFDVTGTQYLRAASFSGVTAAPLTLSCWTNPTITNLNVGIFGIYASNQGTHHAFYFGAVNNTPSASIAATSSFSSANATAAMTIGTWNHLAGVYTSATSRDIYLNAGNTANDATNLTPSNISQAVAGGFWNSSNDTFSGVSSYDGQLADCAIWNAALDVSEIAALAKGYSARLIRPNKLVFYMPLVRNSNDYRGGITVTEVGSPTVIAHPRIIMPHNRRDRRLTTAAAAAGGGASNLIGGRLIA